MVKRTRLARRLAVYISLILFVMTLLINGTIILLMELRLQSISKEASEEYLEVKIQSMDISTYQFVQSFDQLVGNMKTELNNTALTIVNQFFSEEASTLYQHDFLNFNSTDEYAYIDGIIDMKVDRENNLGYYDHDKNGINDLETTGCCVFGDIETRLNISGEFYLQINATFEGELSNQSSVFIYAHKNNEVFMINITEYYQTNYSNSFSNLFLEQWNLGLYTFPTGLDEELSQLEPDYLDTFFLVKEHYTNNNCSIVSSGSKSRIEGCINGSLSGQFTGLIKGKYNGTASGYIDTRLKELYDFMIPLLNPMLQWVYFATPNYILIFPWFPDYGSSFSIGLSADFDWKRRPWYNELLQAEEESTNKGMESHFSDLGVDYVHQNIFISLGQAVYNDTNDFQGFWVLDLNLDYLMNTLELDITENDYSLIINSDKEILLSPHYAANVSRKPKEDFPTENMADYENPELQFCVNAVLNFQSGYRIVTHNDTVYIVLYHPIFSIPWFMLHFSPLDLVMEDFDPILATLRNNLRYLEIILIIASISIIAIIGAVALYIAFNFSNYAVTLLKGIKAISEGDFSVSFVLSKRLTKEVSEVYFAFEDMALKLDESIRKEKESIHLAELAMDLFTHDLSNYHQAILGYLELAKMQNGDFEESTKLIEQSIRILKRANTVKDRIRKLSSLEKTAEPFVKRKLETYINKAITTLEQAYPNHNISLKKNFDTEIRISANKFLEDVFTNIFENSIQSAKNSKISFIVSASRIKDQQKDFWEIVIEDNGKGISDERKQQILDSFQSGQRIRGLGMMFIYRIVKAYEGSIRIEDRIEGDYTQGAKIIFSIRDYE
ncbi:MAG: sensor histidine kinase [Candidatus Heimdallarchaeota archaeon]|nr:sensor histidine kinase [Candidatus Heimdallarchaeota archaeon]MCG3257226.1 sensor histidine kinase [Candidatus Heimdallarchaeota archaeon]MCK4612284.1 sensor histidine kinase [Candidatus Heimdallarchaeota archaeon]